MIRAPGRWLDPGPLGCLGVGAPFAIAAKLLNPERHQIRIPQLQRFGAAKSPGTLLAPTRYDKLVQAMGGYGENVTEPAQIRPAIERALQCGTVACVNVMLDPDAPTRSGALGYAA